MEKQVLCGGYQRLKPYLGGCREGVDPAEADIYDFLPPAHLEVADKLGISRSYVSRIEKKAMERLKEAFETGDPVKKER